MPKLDIADDMENTRIESVWAYHVISYIAIIAAKLQKTLLQMCVFDPFHSWNNGINSCKLTNFWPDQGWNLESQDPLSLSREYKKKNEFSINFEIIIHFIRNHYTMTLQNCALLSLLQLLLHANIEIYKVKKIGFRSILSLRDFSIISNYYGLLI